MINIIILGYKYNIEMKVIQIFPKIIIENHTDLDLDIY